MRVGLEQIQKIEQFLEGKLQATEKIAFEKQIAGNSLLQEEVKLQQDIMRGVERFSLRQDAKRAFYKYKRGTNFLRWGLTSFSILLVSIGFFIFNKSNVELLPEKKIDTNLYQENEITKQDSNVDISPSIQSVGLNNPTDKVPVNNNFEIKTNPEIIPYSATEKIMKDGLESPINNIQLSEAIDSNLSQKKGDNLRDIFLPETKITWLGIDFSQVKLMGNFSEFAGAGVKDNITIRNKYFRDWNNLIINEKKKYDFDRALQKSDVPYDLGYINKRNYSMNAEELFSTNSEDANRFKASDIQQIINTYELEGKSGIGFVFIVESLDKPNENGNVWVAFINMETKTVLLTQKMSSKPGGIGLRNYWGRCFYNVIVEIEQFKYQQWKKQYSK